MGLWWHATTRLRWAAPWLLRAGAPAGGTLPLMGRAGVVASSAQQLAALPADMLVSPRDTLCVNPVHSERPVQPTRTVWRHAASAVLYRVLQGRTS
ncbi:MAG: hypothetical protein EOO65_01885 [Methanosarcinales archaeon]|nr:MAG: hypothetical protein EOO65_01885 [Methanosarcinales archaeon]